MRDEVQIIRIPEYLIKENYAQLTFPFKKNFTLFSTDFKYEGLICNYDVNYYYQNINNHEISVYRGINGKYYIDQILELNKQYFTVTQSIITNICISKVKDNYLLIKRILNIPQGMRSLEYSVGKLLCSINSIMAIDSKGNIYYNIGNSYDSTKEFIINGGGILIQEDEDLNINFEMIQIRKSYSPYYYYVKECQIPTSEYIYEEKKKKLRIKEFSIPRFKRRCRCDTKRD